LREFAKSGRTVVLITHKLREALEVADDVTVLRRGHTVLAQTTSLATEASVTLAMLGEAAAAVSRANAAVTGGIALRVEHVSVAGTREARGIEDVTLHVSRGEVLGVAGVENSGHHVLLRLLAGRTKPTSGEVWAAGAVAFVPEDRQRDALVLDFTLAENVALKGAGARRGRMRWAEWRRLTSQLVRDFDVRAGGVDAPAGSLSGGNQQKLVLARELDGAPVAVVAENPTRGLDIRSSAAVHAKLRDAAANGMAVVVYSADLDEVLGLATRVVAVHAGQVLNVARDREAVGRAMLGLGS
jgi:simple sugar transport system ATP-binding protein